MPFKVNGELLPDVDHIRVREMCEAEKALGLNAGEVGMAGQMALALYVALRRQDPERSAGLIADEVLDVDMATIEEAEDESPPATSPVDETGEQALESPPTIGPRPLEASG
jgi:hypothetical protein